MANALLIDTRTMVAIAKREASVVEMTVNLRQVLISAFFVSPIQR